MSNEILNETLPIFINGHEKLASGLTKRTTINDIKFALLSVTEKSFDLNDYAIFEKWQGNERILDGSLKIYKLIRLWKALPGNQLDSVKFMIKKRKNIVLTDITNQQRAVEVTQGKSPSSNKTWAKNRVLRKQAELKQSQKRSVSRNRQSDSSDDEQLHTRQQQRSRSKSIQRQQSQKRYSSIKRFNRSKNSTIRKTFVELVQKQNEIIDKQLNTIAQKDTDLEKFNQQQRQLKKRSKSCENKQPAVELIVKDDVDVTKNDILNVFDDVLNDKQALEYVNLCNQYFQMDKNLNANQFKITQLKQTIKENENQAAIENMDKIIYLKTNLIKNLENELKLLDSNQEHPFAPQQQQIESAKSSTSSLMSSISQQQVQSYAQTATKIYNDNESDTGISSANSDDCNQHHQLETLV